MSLRAGAAAAAALLVLLPGAGSPALAATTYAAPVTDAACDAGSLPETVQGRVSKADLDSGRAAKGYTCNTRLVSSIGDVGGFRVERYTDAAGHTCAYYDSTLLLGRDLAQQQSTGYGVYVVDMDDPTKPVVTTTLKTPAMLSPHESLRVNAKRGLLAADMGNPGTYPGQVDVYDLTADCRAPVLKSSLPLGILGHESGFAPDGKTFYVASTGGHTLAALDLTDPTLPKVLWVTGLYVPHAVSLSADGNRLYMASDDPQYSGVIVLDVTQVQNRTLNPQVPEVSRLTWPSVSIPQIAIPVTIKGHPYLVEDDEYTSATLNPTVTTPQVGAARIIDIADEKHPFVASDMRLAINNLAYRGTDVEQDPGQDNAAQGYAAHYCSVPTLVDPTVVACSFIQSGLRLFDIRDPLHPTEVGYYNAPNTAAGVTVPAGGATRSGSYAMSSPGYDLARNQVWYSDGNHGFNVVQLSGAAAAALQAAPAASQQGPPATVQAAVPAAEPALASTGLDGRAWAVAATLLVAAGGAVRRRRTASGLPTVG